VPLLLAVPAALLSLDKWAIGVTLLACGVWGGDFGPELARSPGSGPADLKILSQNVSSPPDLGAVARLAEQRQADIVVLQGLSSHDVEQADQTVPAQYPYHLALYEFVVWSRFKLVDGGVPVDLAARPTDSATAQQPAGTGGTGQFGGLLRFTVQLDQSRSATVYAVHLPQPSLSHDGFGVTRADALQQLVKAVQAEAVPNLVVVGDLDLAQTDRGMGKLLNSDGPAVGAGQGRRRLRLHVAVQLPDDPTGRCADPRPGAGAERGAGRCGSASGASAYRGGSAVRALRASRRYSTTPGGERPRLRAATRRFARGANPKP
jgi:hypothetical protein